MNSAYLLTGGNIGDRLQHLEQARNLIAQQAGNVIQSSSVYETAAWGLKEQGPFLNQVLNISTSLSPLELLQTVLNIEQQLGRLRFEKMGPRTIDIDILLYNDEIIVLPNLKVPHPELQNRRFVLTPLNEIAPQIIHPVLGKTIAVLLDECLDNLPVKKLVV